MILYHGSNCIVTNPDISYSLKYLDFGMGFYTTTVKEQAERWARRKAVVQNNNFGFVSVFEYTEKDSFKIQNFGDNLEDWIDFVCACRAGSDIFKQHDVIKGKVADDKVFRVVDMYRKGIWDKKRAIKEIKVYETYDQIVFISQKAINEMLVFKEGYGVRI